MDFSFLISVPHHSALNSLYIYLILLPAHSSPKKKMRIACLQFSPQLGNLQSNILRADALLSSSPNLHNLDFLILPELALTGLPPHIFPFPHIERRKRQETTFLNSISPLIHGVVYV